MSDDGLFDVRVLWPAGTGCGKCGRPFSRDGQLLGPVWYVACADCDPHGVHYRHFLPDGPCQACPPVAPHADWPVCTEAAVIAFLGRVRSGLVEFDPGTWMASTERDGTHVTRLVGELLTFRLARAGGGGRGVLLLTGRGLRILADDRRRQLAPAVSR